jgi:hypothetical protein
MTMCLLLADLTPTQQQNLMLWGFILMGAVIVGSFAILFIRRWLRDPTGGVTADAGFSLSELRAMRDRGEITSEEYEHTRARVISKVKASANAPRPKKTADGWGSTTSDPGLADGGDVTDNDAGDGNGGDSH